MQYSPFRGKTIGTFLFDRSGKRLDSPGRRNRGIGMIGAGEVGSRPGPPWHVAPAA